MMLQQTRPFNVLNRKMYIEKGPLSVEATLPDESWGFVEILDETA